MIIDATVLQFSDAADNPEFFSSGKTFGTRCDLGTIMNLMKRVSHPGKQMPLEFADPSRRRPFTAFVIMHDQAFRAQVSFALSQAGLEVEFFLTALEFCLGPNLHRPGVIFIGDKVPGMSVEELLKRLSESSSGLAVVVVGSKGSIARAIPLLNKGASDFIQRPMPDEDLVSCVARAYCVYHGESTDLVGESDAEVWRGLQSLTDREREVLEHFLAGNSSASIARALGVRTKTIEAHRSYINAKMRSKDSAHLLRMCRQVAFPGTGTLK